MMITDKNKKILLLLGIAATFFVFAALTKKTSAPEKSSPESLPEELKKAFDILSEKVTSLKQTRLLIKILL
jgi:hypothetical protein